MKHLLSVLIIAVVASQAMMWHSIAIRDAIHQTNAIISAACGSAHKGQIELGSWVTGS